MSVADGVAVLMPWVGKKKNSFTIKALKNICLDDSLRGFIKKQMHNNISFKCKQDEFYNIIQLKNLTWYSMIYSHF